MAKKSAATGNKSQAIRDALAAHPDKGPKEIAELLQAEGYKVNGQYVSIIKSNLNKKAGTAVRKVRVKKAGAKTLGVTSGSPLLGMDAALELIRSAGGLNEAREVLAMIEQIKAAF